MSDEFDAADEAERFLRSLRHPDLTYASPEYVDGAWDWVSVATFGAADELSANDGPEPMPIRLRVANVADQLEAEAYLTVDEAQEVIAMLQRAIERAAGFPQPE